MTRAAARRPRLLVPAISTAVMVAIMLALGIWQVQRLAWKRDLLARIDAAEAAPPVPLPPDAISVREFAKVSATGTFQAARHALYGVDVRQTRAGQALGARLIVPLDRPGGLPLLVDLGWVPTDRPLPAPPAGPVSVTGYLRTPDHAGSFAAADDAGKARFFTLDPAAIGRALGLEGVAPFVLVALGPARAAGQRDGQPDGPPDGALYPDPARALPRPPNDHLQYAITWFGLAIVLMAVFAAYVRKARRAP